MWHDSCSPRAQRFWVSTVANKGILLEWRYAALAVIDLKDFYWGAGYLCYAYFVILVLGKKMYRCHTIGSVCVALSWELPHVWLLYTLWTLPFLCDLVLTCVLAEFKFASSRQSALAALHQRCEMFEMEHNKTDKWFATYSIQHVPKSQNGTPHSQRKTSESTIGWVFRIGNAQSKCNNRN